MILALYIVGLVYLAATDNAASRDPKRFWWALLGWPVVAPVGAVNSLLNRMW